MNRHTTTLPGGVAPATPAGSERLDIKLWMFQQGKTIPVRPSTVTTRRWKMAILATLGWNCSFQTNVIAPLEAVLALKAGVNAQHVNPCLQQVVV
eukprot:scaffold431_cov334-Pavlova_lutheri.AAC.119